MATILETLGTRGGFETMLTALKTVGVDAALDATGPLTLFAPADEAFTRLPRLMMEKLLADRELLRRVVAYQLLAGPHDSDDMATRSSIETLSHDRLPVHPGDGLSVDGATVIEADIICDNGILHIVDTVLLPAAEEERQSA